MIRNILFLSTLALANGTLCARTEVSDTVKAKEVSIPSGFGGRMAVWMAYTPYQDIDSLKAKIKPMMEKYFRIHYGCAPMSYVGICRLLGAELPDEQLHRLSSTFSGGIGGSLDGTCGALTGAVMALNAYASGDEQKLKGLTRELLEDFRSKYGSITCVDIRKNRDKGRRCDQCTSCCMCAANKVIEILYREGDIRLSTSDLRNLPSEKHPELRITL